MSPRHGAWEAGRFRLPRVIRTCHSQRASKNFAINNAGPIFWWDIITPLTLLIVLLAE